MKVAHLFESYRDTPYGITDHNASEDEQAVCDNILSYMTKAHRSLMQMDTDTITLEAKQKLQAIYNSWRTHLMHGDLAAWGKDYDDTGAHDTDAFDFFVQEMFDQAGIDPHKGTIEDFMEKCGAHSLKLHHNPNPHATWGVTK